jgi:1-phosphatidylinositol-4-phosphate 5-kinase
MAGVSSEEVLSSLHAEFNRKNVFKAGQGAGRSGSFFFFTADNRFIIKSLRGNEKHVLLRLLRPFYNYLASRSGKTLIAKIYGLFSIRTSMYAPMDFVVMENVSRLNNQENFKVTFDMKGSTFRRYANLQNKQKQFWKRKLDCSGVLKDLNFLEISKAIGNKLLDLS